MQKKSRKRHNVLTVRRRNQLWGLVYVSPFIIGTLLFFAYPIFMSLRMSLSEIVNTVGIKMEWRGFQNYEKAFVWDINFIPMFLEVIKYTFINTPLIVIYSLIIAVVLNKKIGMRTFFRGIFFLPFILGTGYILQQLLGQGVEEKTMSVARGIFLPHTLISYFGPKVYSTINYYLNIMTVVMWKSGVQILLFLSGLQQIPISLYEAAKVDSASEWEMFWLITLPMMAPVILLTLVYTIIVSFTDISNPIVTYIIEQGFNNSQFEYGAAMGWIYFSFIMIVIGLVFLIMRKRVSNVSTK